jgi:hypothetical protein
MLSLTINSTMAYSKGRAYNRRKLLQTCYRIILDSRNEYYQHNGNLAYEIHRILSLHSRKMYYILLMRELISRRQELPIFSKFSNGSHLQCNIRQTYAAYLWITYFTGPSARSYCFLFAFESDQVVWFNGRHAITCRIMENVRVFAGHILGRRHNQLLNDRNSSV